MGLFFESMCIRDLREFSEALGGMVYHYRDKSGLECHAVVHLRNGSYALIEIKLGGSEIDHLIHRLKGNLIMFSDVEIKLRKKNKILFSRDSQCLQELIKLIEIQNHRTIVMWALDCAKITLGRFEEKYPNEPRPRTALEQCELWARGKIKMPIAKKAILEAHAVAKEINDDEYGALCHAIGHAGATVHVGSHALGLPFYELTAVVLEYDKDDYQKPVSEKIEYYCQRLLYWQENTDKLGYEWAEFLA